MLIGIPAIIPPELLKILDEMGHGDELTIGDANFPGHSCCKNVMSMLTKCYLMRFQRLSMGYCLKKNITVFA